MEEKRGPFLVISDPGSTKYPGFCDVNVDRLFPYGLPAVLVVKEGQITAKHFISWQRLSVSLLRGLDLSRTPSCPSIMCYQTLVKSHTAIVVSTVIFWA